MKLSALKQLREIIETIRDNHALPYRQRQQYRRTSMLCEDALMRIVSLETITFYDDRHRKEPEVEWKNS